MLSDYVVYLEQICALKAKRDLQGELSTPEKWDLVWLVEKLNLVLSAELIEP